MFFLCLELKWLHEVTCLNIAKWQLEKSNERKETEKKNRIVFFLKNLQLLNFE